MTDGKTDATDDSVSMNGAFTENVRTRSVIAQLREAVCKMHRREDAKRLVRLIWTGLRELEIPFLSCGINLIDQKGADVAIRIYRSDDAPGCLPDDDPGAKVLHDIWQGQQVAYRRDLREEDPWGEAEWTLPYGICCIVDVPFSQGTLAVNSTEPSAFSAEHVEIFREMAAVLSEWFTRLQDQEVPDECDDSLVQEAATWRHRKRMETIQSRLREAIWDMKHSDELDRILDAVLWVLQELELPFSNCGINLIDDIEKPMWVHGYTSSWDGEWEKDRLRPADAVVEIWGKGAVCYRRDLAAEDPYEEREALRAVLGMDIRSVVDVPFAQGTLALNSIWAEMYSADDIDILQQMAAVLSEGFTRWRDLDALREQAAELKRTNDLLEEKEEILNSFQQIAEITLSTLDLDEIAARLPREVIRAGFFRSLSFSVVNEKTRTIEVMSSLHRDKDGELVGEDTEKGSSYGLDDRDILAQVARTGTFEIIEGWDEERYTPHGHSPAVFEDKVAYFVPVKKQERVLAVLATASRKKDREQTLYRIGLMEPLLSQMAITLEQVHLYRELRQAHESEEEEQRQQQAEQTVRLKIAQMDEPDEMGAVVEGLREQLTALGVAHDSCSVQVVNEQGTDYLSGISRDFFARKAHEGHPFFTQGLDWEKVSDLPEQHPWVIEVWKTGTPRYDPHSQISSLPAGSSVIDVPFSHGTLAICAHRPHAFGERSIEILQRFARVLTDGFQRYLDLIAKQQAVDSLHTAYEQMEACVRERTAQLKEANANLQHQIEERKCEEDVQASQLRLIEYATNHSITELLQKFLDETEALMDSEIGFFHFVEEDQETLALQTWSTNTLESMCTAESERLHYPSSEAGVWVDCVHERRPVIHNDYANLSHKKGLPESHAPVIRELVVPVLRGGKIVAILGMGNKRTDYDDEDVKILQRLADLAWESVSRKQTEVELQKLSLAVEQSPASIVITNKEGEIEYVNPKFCTTTGYTVEEILGQNPRVLKSGTQSSESYRELWDTITSGKEWRGEFHNKKKDGELYWELASISPITNSAGVITHFVAVKEDITEQKRMEEEIRRAHNLKSLGLLAGGIAHDFNNVLTGVMGSLALLQHFLDKDSMEHEIASEAQQAATKTKALTQQLMTFAKGGTPIKETASIEELIRETTSLSLHGANTRPEFHFSDGLPSVDIDTGQISQVIQNLVLNADQAMPNGGTLKISADHVEVAAGDPLPLEAGTYVRVSVEDQGIGISDDLLSQVFDPYFSTKETGHGLGLSICHSIIQRHNGHITVSSRQNVGTTFEFYLPASEEQVITVTENEREWARGTGKILLMDDEETIHQMMGRTLKALGYEVESVYDGKEVLQAYKVALETDKPFDVVIMDLTIPGGMGGKEAIGKLLVIDPRVQALVSSGYSNDPVMADFAEYGFAGSVAKPVDIEELADMVKRILTDRE